MKKIYFILLLLCGLCVQAMAQSSTAVFYAVGAPGSYRTGCSNPTVATEGTMTVSSGIGVSRAFGVFDLSGLPSDAVITSVEIGFNITTNLSFGSGGSWATYGRAGDMSIFAGSPPTLFSVMATSTFLTNASYGTTTGNTRLPSAPASVAFIQANVGGTVSISFTTNAPRAYNFTTESGISDTTGAHAPYLIIKYACAGLTGVGASASPTTVCPGSPVTLTGTATGAGSYLWEGPAGGLSTTTTATASPTAATEYTFTATSASGTGCSTTAKVTVGINPAPSAGTSTSGATAICVGSTVDLFASMPVAGETYQWYESGTVLSGSTNSLYTASASGTYSLQVTNGYGCNTMSSGIPVLVLSTPTLTPSGTVNVCSVSGGSVLLTVNTGGVTSGLDYQWMKDGVAISGATNSTYTATASGNYISQVSLTGGSCVSLSVATNVNIASYPNPPITYNGSVVSTSSSYIGYQWFLNSVAIPGATSYNYVPAANGTYIVKVTNAAGCVNYSAALAVGNVGVEEHNKTDISIYPNPATNIVRIDAAYNVNAVITSVDGRAIMEQKAATEMNIGHLPKGIYLIRLYSQDGQQLVVRKLIKE
jgi:hypothetical protein